MTLVLAMAHEDRVEFLTDRAAIDPAGVLVSVGPKVRTRTGPVMGVTYRGRAALLDVATAALFEAVDRHGFDGGLAVLVDLMASQRALLERHGADFDLLVAGVSETAGVGLWILPSHSHYPGMPAWRATKAPVGFAVALGGRIDIPALEAKGVERAAAVASIHRGTLLFDFGVQIASTMREASGFEDGTAPERFAQCSIGGGVDLTVVSAAGSTTLDLHTWHQDEIGQPIDPFRAPLNRAQRRALRRAA